MHVVESKSLLGLEPSEALLFGVSAVVSMLVFVAVEGPVQARHIDMQLVLRLSPFGCKALVGYGGHSTSQTLPATSVTRMTTNGAANGHTSVANGSRHRR